MLRVLVDRAGLEAACAPLLERMPFDALNSNRGQSKSGGERAIATIMYLLAVQQLFRRPIRMVDEINQGMDPHNERQAYNAIGRISESALGATQFFLFSPKLLMNEHRFEYPMSMTVLLVHKGKFMIPSEDWDLAGFLRAMRATERRRIESVAAGGKAKGTGGKRKSPDQGVGRATKSSRR